MLHVPKHRALGLIVALVGSMVVASSSETPKAPAQQAERITVELINAPIDKLLAELSDQLNRPVVLDGHYHRTVSLRVDEPAPDAIRTIARILDLHVIESKSGAVLLVRRFQTEPGVPQAPRAQIAYWAAGLQRVLPVVPPRLEPLGWNVEVRQLASMLTPVQFLELKAGSPIAYGALLPDQRRQFEQAIYSRVFGGAVALAAILKGAAENPVGAALQIDPATNQVALSPPGPDPRLSVILGFSLPQEQP